MKVNVGVINSTEAFETEETSSGQYYAKRGFDYEFLKVLANALNFTFNIIPQKSWVIPKENENFTGMVAFLQRCEVDVVIGRQPIRPLLHNLVDYSFPYDITRITFAVKTASERSKAYAIFYPFDVFTWSCLFATILVFTIIIYFYHYISLQKSAKKSLFFSLKYATGKCTIPLPKNIFLGVCFALYMLMIFVLCCSYNGTLLSTIVAPIYEFQIDTVEDLIKACSNDKIKVITSDDRRFWLLDYDGIMAAQLHNCFYKYTKNFAAVNVSPAYYIKNGHAFFGGELFLRLRVLSARSSLQIHFSSDSIKTVPIVIIFRKGFSYRMKFDEMISRVFQSGTYNKILNDHFFQMHLKYTEMISTNNVRQLSLIDFIGIFWAFILCKLLCLIVFIFEYKTISC